MRDLRREQTHGVARGTALVAVQIVADRAVIDDQQRPGVVDVHGVRVLGEVRVENFHDARDRGRQAEISCRDITQRTYKT